MQTVFEHKFWWFGIIAFVLFNLFIGATSMPLWEEDEAAYAAISQQMLVSGDWVNPNATWCEVHRKPPLHFWTILLSYKIFGVNEFATRLPSAISYLLLLFFLYWFTRRQFDPSIAALSVLILASSFLVPNLAKIGMTDNGLLLVSTVAMLAFYQYLKTPALKWNAIVWLCVSLGVLIKGPPILILVLGTWGFLFLFAKDRKPLIRMHPWLWLPLALIPLLIWGYVSWQRDDGETVWFLLDWYILKRFTGEGHVFGQTGPPGYHLAVYLLAFLPWWAFFPKSLYTLFTNVRSRSTESLFFMGWLVFGWFFYELMSSKLPSYSLAAMPGVAILAAKTGMIAYKQETQDNWVKSGAVFTLLVSFFVMVAVVVAAHYLGGRTGMRRGVLIAALCWPLAMMGSVGLFSGKLKFGIPMSGIFGLMFTGLVWWLLGPFVGPRLSTSQQITQQMVVEWPADTQIILGEGVKQMPGIPFYLSQHFKEVSYENMLEDAQERYDSNEGQQLYIMGDYWYQRWNKEWESQGKTLEFSRQLTYNPITSKDTMHYWLIANFPSIQKYD